MFQRTEAHLAQYQGIKNFPVVSEIQQADFVYSREDK